MFEAELQLYRAQGSDYFWFQGKRQLIWSLLHSYQPQKAAAGRVLDLGCGPGFALKELRRWGPMVVGLDSSEEALRGCQNGFPGTDSVKLMRADAAALPYRADAFQWIVSLDLLEHIENDEAVLQECRRILKPEGWLILSVPAFRWLWGDHDTRYGHLRRYTVPGLKEKLRRAEFQTVKITYIQFLFVVPLWILRNFKRMLPHRWRPETDFVKVPAGLNRWLTRLITAEALWLNRWSLPAGASIVALCRKS